jgi:methylenetetrahydrofolate--tRNA-(uracil-5-)-methyltransferase
VALALKARLRDKPFVPPPPSTALGALLGHVAGTESTELKTYGPENVHWGMVPPLTGRVRKADKKARLVERARADFSAWLVAVLSSGDD